MARRSQAAVSELARVWPRQGALRALGGMSPCATLVNASLAAGHTHADRQGSERHHGLGRQTNEEEGGKHRTPPESPATWAPPPRGPHRPRQGRPARACLPSGEEGSFLSFSSLQFSMTRLLKCEPRISCVRLDLFVSVSLFRVCALCVMKTAIVVRPYVEASTRCEQHPLLGHDLCTFRNSGF